MSSGTNQQILQLLDKSVRWTGIPDLIEGGVRRRPLRWISTVALAFAVTGFLVGLAQPSVWWSDLPLWLGVLTSNVMPLLGPIKPWGGHERADEFDQALRGRSYLVAFWSLAAVAVLGLWLTLGLSILYDWNADDLRWAIFKLTILLPAILSAGPTCYASWKIVPVNDDD